MGRQKISYPPLKTQLPEKEKKKKKCSVTSELSDVRWDTSEVRGQLSKVTKQLDFKLPHIFLCLPTHSWQLLISLIYNQ